jgi:hypothetical protein
MQVFKALAEALPALYQGSIAMQFLKFGLIELLLKASSLAHGRSKKLQIDTPKN